RAAAARAARSPLVSRASWSSCTPYMSAAKISASGSLTARPRPPAGRLARAAGWPGGSFPLSGAPIDRLQPCGDDRQLGDGPAAEQVQQPPLGAAAGHLKAPRRGELLRE